MGKRKQMKNIIKRLYMYYFNDFDKEVINSIMVDLEILTGIELTDKEIDECMDL